MKPAWIHAAARVELDDAMAYYESCSKGLGLDLQAQVERAVRRIQKHPKHWPPHKQSGFRKCQVGRFPHLVFYKELPDVIWIAAIAHPKRCPDYWRGRRIENP